MAQNYSSVAPFNGMETHETFRVSSKFVSPSLWSQGVAYHPLSTSLNTNLMATNFKTSQTNHDTIITLT